jgi:ABC-type Fe3+/spermidine/putrescine transport system ATPase subunit
VLEPALLLLDEPLSNLDTNLRNEMRIEIKRLHNELGLTTVYVTHDQSEAMSLSDKVVVMRLGHIEQVGTPQEIYKSPRSLFVARFMGYLNRFPVTLLAREGEHWLVQTTTGAKLTASVTTTESADWQIGQKVLACIRPDETLADDPSATNRVQGRVLLVEYVGRAYEVLVQLAGEGNPQLLVHTAHAPEMGSVLEFALHPERLLLFTDDETNGGSSSESYSRIEPAVLKVER